MNLRKQLQDFEGLRLKAYLDTVGVWTIGYGHTGPEVCEGVTWPPEKAEAQLDADIAEKTAEVCKCLPWVAGMSEPRKAVVLGMAFQLGTRGLLGFRNTLASMRDERWEHAANGMLMSKWAKQTPRRVQRLARQLTTGEWN